MPAIPVPAADAHAALAGATDEQIRAAIADAELPPLLVALAQLTGGDDSIPASLHPSALRRFAPQGGYDAEQIANAQELAFQAITSLRDGAAPAADAADADAGDAADARMLALASFLLPREGYPSEKYLPLLLDELSDDPGAPGWRKEDIAPDRPFSVVVIGAGMSGLLAGHRLQQAGVEFRIIEKNDEVGGTWLENTYPGCRVDVSNHMYSYSFAQRTDWPNYFSPQGVLLDYFRDFADSAGLRDSIAFGTEVLSARYDDGAGMWSVTVRGPGGAIEQIDANAVITAVGQLNRPSFPAIEGREDFAGQSFHSAQWRHDIDLTGKRVAVIGTGASAFQFVPIIAEQAAQLTIFQRNPPWLGPSPLYHEAVADGLQWLFGHIPGYSRWYRFWLFSSSVEGMLAQVEVDPDWDGGERSVSAANDRMRSELTKHLERQFGDRPDLLAAAIPNYPPGAKRMLADNGVWAKALKRPNVELVTEGIDRIDASGVATAAGRHIDADVLIYATGFAASDFLAPMTIVGRDGVELHDRWNGDARAYLGISVPGFPNLFCMYGPNTNIVVNGSIIFFSECEASFILECVRTLLTTGGAALDVTQEAHDEYNAMIDEANRKKAWGASGVSAWYKNSYGRVSQNWPFTLMDYWERSRTPVPEHYVLR